MIIHTREVNNINNNIKTGERVLIGFNTNVSSFETQDNINLIYNYGGMLRYTYSLINGIAARIPAELIDILKYDPNIRYIEPALEAHTTAQEIPWGIYAVKAPIVHNSGYKGTGVKVAIIDTGIDYNHEDLKDNYKGGYNFITNSNDPFDDNGHGSHVAGIIAARDNTLGVLGVAPEANLYAPKALNCAGSGWTDDLIAALNWCKDNGMQIINMSWGYGKKCNFDTNKCEPRDPGQAMADAISTLYNAGILMIAAAGNECSSTCTDYKDGVFHCQGTWCGANTDYVIYPARYPEVIAVGAVQQTDTGLIRAQFSSTGPKVELCAPGVGILSSFPTWRCAHLPPTTPCTPNGYIKMNGTSMACPHVVGVAALVMGAHPNYSHNYVRQILVNSATDLGTQGRDIQFGYGLVNAQRALEGSGQPPLCNPPICTFEVS